MVKVAVIGAGFMGETHSAAYAGIQGVTIAGIVARTPRRRRRLAAKYGVPDFGSIEECMQAVGPDFVDICVPPSANLPLVRAAARKGKHIVLEKPIALTLKDADEIIRITRQAGVSLMPAHVLRFWPDYVVIKKALQANRIGTPLSASAQRVCTIPPNMKWYQDPKLAGGAALSLVFHDFDMLNWLFGRPERVFATGHKGDLGSLDDLFCTVSYPGGVEACVQGSFLMPARFPFTMGLRVLGRKGCIDFRFTASVNLEEREKAGRELKLYTARTQKDLEAPEKDPFSAELEHFVKCVRTGKSSETVTPQDARLALQVALACVTSAETGRPISID